MRIEIPDDLGVTEEQARLDFAVGLYTSHSASLARAARLAGLSRIDFQRVLAERDIPLAYDSNDLNDDLATLTRLPQSTNPVSGPAPAPDDAETTLSPEAEAEARALGLDIATISPLGRDLLEARAHIIATRTPLLSWEEIDAEMAEQRGDEMDEMPE